MPPSTADGKIELAARLVERLVAAGVPLDDIYVDSLVFPVGVDSRSASATIEAIGEIMRRFPGVHTICGLSVVRPEYPVPDGCSRRRRRGLSTAERGKHAWT